MSVVIRDFEVVPAAPPPAPAAQTPEGGKQEGAKKPLEEARCVENHLHYLAERKMRLKAY